MRQTRIFTAASWRWAAAVALAVWCAGPAALAQEPATVYLKSSGPAVATLSNCTNATPIVCTTTKAHDLTVGDTVVISNVVGNTAANGRFRIKAVPSPTQFSLSTMGGADAAGNGNWHPGGTPTGLASPKIVGKVNPFQLKAHPRIMLDGPDGQLTRRLRCAISTGCLTSISVQDGIATATVPGGHGMYAGAHFGVWNSATAELNGEKTVTAATPTTYSFATTAPNGIYTDSLLSVSEYAFDSNPAWNRMRIVATGFAPLAQTHLVNPSMEKYVAAALVWYTDRSATNLLEAARWIVNNPVNAIYGTGICNQSIIYCGHRTATDVGRFNLVNLSTVYSILVSENQLSLAERTAFRNFMLADVEDGCTLAPVQDGTGTLSIQGYNDVAGTGTNFSSTLQPGSVVWFPTVTDENLFRVESIQSDTAMTVNRPQYFNGAFKYARGWQPGDCGAVFILKNHVSSVVGDPYYYPPRGAEAPQYYHNLSLTALWAYVHIGVALADEDERARKLLESAWLFGYDMLLAYAMNTWTGMTQTGSVYHWYRSPWMGADLAFMATRIFQGFPNLLSSPHWLLGVLPIDYYFYLPFANRTNETGFFMLFGEGTLAVDPYWVGYHTKILRLFEGTDEARAWKWWLENRYGYSSATIAWNQGQGSVFYYLGLNPNLQGLDNTQLPAQYVLNRTGYEACAELGMRYCNDPGKKYAIAVSRTSWTDPTASQVQIYGGTYQPDHFDNLAGDYRIVKGMAGSAPCLLGGDWTTCAIAYGGLQQNNLLEIGTGYARKEGTTTPDPIADIARWAGTHPSGDADSRYMYAMVDLTDVFKPAYDVSRAHRHFAHFKLPGTQDILVVYDDVAVGTPANLRSYTHYSQNGAAGEGTTTCAGGCSTTNITSGRVVSQSTENTLVSQFLSPAPSTRFRLFVNNTDGTYPGGNNRTFRLTYCATTDDATCSSAANKLETIIVHRIVGGTADTTLTANLLSGMGTEWTGAQTADKVVVFARNGQLPARLGSLQTSHAGTAQYLIAGLRPGLYNVIKDGTPLLSNQVVAAKDNSLYFEGTAGLYVVAPVTPPNEETASAGAGNTVGVASYLPSSPAACNWQLASNPAFTENLQTGSDSAEAGGPWRQVPLSGLAMATRYYFQAACPGGVTRNGSVETGNLNLPALRPVVISQRPVPAIGADNVLVEWGSSPLALNNSASATCGSGCAVTINVAPNSVLFTRSTYRAGSNVRARTEVRRIHVP